MLFRSVSQSRYRQLTFGGLGLQAIPYATLAHFPDWQFLTFDRHAPKLPNLLSIQDPAYRPVDLMPLCHCILSKPGYGTFSEACRVGVPIVTLTREDFAESPLLFQGIQNHSLHRIITPDTGTNSTSNSSAPPCTFRSQPSKPAQTTTTSATAAGNPAASSPSQPATAAGATSPKHDHR